MKKSPAHLRYAGAPADVQRHTFERIVREDKTLAQLLELLRTLDLPDWRLVAGCLYQTVWNVLTERPQGYGINDYDVSYFDDADVSWAAEDREIKRAAELCRAFPGEIEIRNQARVHLWFEDRFGTPYGPLKSTNDGIDRYASVTHMVGIREDAAGQLDIYAPKGLDAIFAFRLEPNRVIDNSATHERKSRRCLDLWPELTYTAWEEN